MADKYQKAAEEMVAVVLPLIGDILTKQMRAMFEELDRRPPPDTRPACYACGCRSDRERNWMGRSICSKCQPEPPR